jgi:hypothetical protein
MAAAKGKGCTPQITIFMGGINHSQMDGLLCFLTTLQNFVTFLGKNWILLN